MTFDSAASPMLDAAREYAERGIRVFPVWGITAGRCDCGAASCQAGKHPLGALVPNGLLNATTDAETIRGWWTRFPNANIGTPTDWCVVLDVDVRKGGDESLAALEKENWPGLPDTPEVLTGGGGRHLFFERPATPIRNSAEQVGPGLDVRGEGGYVVLPPSRHASGRAYVDEVSRPLFETKLPPIPDWLRSLMERAASVNGGGQPQEAVDWAALLTGAPKGQRHAVTLKIAGHYLGKRVDPAEVEQLLLLWAGRCVPPFDAAEARQIVRDLAAKDAGRASAPEESPITGTSSDRATPKETPVAIELTALLARDYPEDPGLVGGGLLVRRGLTIVGGSPKLGKSSLVKNLVLQRGRGLPWLGFATTRGTTLVVQSEIPEPELQKRLGIMLKGSTAPPVGTVYFLTDRRIKLDRPDGLALLRAQLERVKPDLLVIDPLARFMVGDENGTRDMGAIIAVLDLLIQEYGLAVLLVHHVGKPSGKPGEGRDGGNRLRGSSALFAAADSVLMLDRADEGFKLTFELRHAQEPAPLYLTRTPALWFTPAGPPDDLLAVAYLVRSGPLRWGQFVKAIRDDTNATKRTAERLLDRTKKAGLVAPDADGHYSATATYRQFRHGGESTT